MKKTKFSSLLLTSLCLSGSLLFSSCEKEPDPKADPGASPVPGAKGPYEHGVFIINEGSLSPGSVSHFNQATKSLKKDIFQDVNSRPLGQYVQSMAIHNEKAYLIAGGSKKIEVVNANTFKSEGVITGFKIPRYMVTQGNKAYVTDYDTYTGDGQVAVVDLSSNTIIKTIPTGINPERLLIINNKLFVTNSGEDNVSVINLETDAVESTIAVGDSPNSLVLDNADKLWVLCNGTKGYDSNFEIDENTSTAGPLYRINPTTKTTEASFTFASRKATANNLNLNAAKNALLYTYNGKVYRMETNATTLPVTALISRGKGFYGLGVDPQENIIYGAYAPDFEHEGKMIRYNPAGAAIDSFNVGVGPNGFLFK